MLENTEAHHPPTREKQATKNLGRYCNDWIL